MRRGTSCAYPSAMLLIQRRARDTGMAKPPGGVLGGLMIAGIATASFGLPLGGVLVNALTWRAIFFVNVPFAVIAFIAAAAWIEPDPKSAERMSAHEIASKLDVPGILGFVAAMLTLLIFLSGLPTARWWVLALSIALWAVLVIWELRARTPFLDVPLLAANPGLANTYLRFGLTQLCVYVVLYGVTQWVEAVRGFSESAAGLLLLPMTLVSGLIITPLSRRRLIRGPVIAAAASCLLGSVGVLLLSSTVWIGIVVSLTLVSVSPSASQPPATRPRSPSMHPPISWAPRPGCCAPSATSVPSAPAPSPAWSSITTSPITASTRSAGS